MLKHRHLQPRPGQMNRAHQARRAGTDDNDTPVTRHETMATGISRSYPFRVRFTAAG